VLHAAVRSSVAQIKAGAVPPTLLTTERIAHCRQIPHIGFRVGL